MEEIVGAIVARLEEAWAAHALPRPKLLLEPGRSLVGRAGVTLYRVGVVKRAGDRTYVGDRRRHVRQPSPAALRRALHSAARQPRRRGDDRRVRDRRQALRVRRRADRRVALPEPRRGDVVAVPATGAYTLAMGSNYNGVTRPAAVLVANGDARLILRRETVADLLAREA